MINMMEYIHHVANTHNCSEVYFYTFIIHYQMAQARKNICTQFPYPLAVAQLPPTPCRGPVPRFPPTASTYTSTLLPCIVVIMCDCQ